MFGRRRGDTICIVIARATYKITADDETTSLATAGKSKEIYERGMARAVVHRASSDEEAPVARTRDGRLLLHLRRLLEHGALLGMRRVSEGEKEIVGSIGDEAGGGGRLT